MISKPHRVRLTGKKYEQFKWFIYNRDGGRCVYCGKPVPTIEDKYGIEHPPIVHHEPPGAYKEDVPEKALLPCDTCHALRESKDGEPIKQKGVAYLDELYPYRREKYIIPA